MSNQIKSLMDSRTPEQILADVKRRLRIHRRDRNKRIRSAREYQHEASTGTYVPYGETAPVAHTPEQWAALRRSQADRIASARYHNRLIVRILRGQRSL